MRWPSIEFSGVCREARYGGWKHYARTLSSSIVCDVLSAVRPAAVQWATWPGCYTLCEAVV